ncbi:2-oxoglutarate-Fe(II) type oxidoreductase-like protein isoform X1 [Tanacetum coccineum]
MIRPSRHTPFMDEALDPSNQLIQGFSHSLKSYRMGMTSYYKHISHIPTTYLDMCKTLDNPEAQRTFYGPNLWPNSDSDTRWEVGRKIARLIALALDLDVNFFDRPEILGNPIAILRLLHYGVFKVKYLTPCKRNTMDLVQHSDIDSSLSWQPENVSRPLSSKYANPICKDKDVKPQAWEDVEPLKG